MKRNQKSVDPPEEKPAPRLTRKTAASTVVKSPPKTGKSAAKVDAKSEETPTTTRRTRVSVAKAQEEKVKVEKPAASKARATPTKAEKATPSKARASTSRAEKSTPTKARATPSKADEDKKIFTPTRRSTRLSVIKGEEVSKKVATLEAIAEVDSTKRRSLFKEFEEETSKQSETSPDDLRKRKRTKKDNSEEESPRKKKTEAKEDKSESSPVSGKRKSPSTKETDETANRAKRAAIEKADTDKPDVEKTQVGRKSTRLSKAVEVSSTSDEPAVVKPKASKTEDSTEKDENVQSERKSPRSKKTVSEDVEEPPKKEVTKRKSETTNDEKKSPVASLKDKKNATEDPTPKHEDDSVNNQTGQELNERRSPRISKKSISEDSTRQSPKKEAKKTVSTSEIPKDEVKPEDSKKNEDDKVSESTERKSPRISRKAENSACKVSPIKGAKTSKSEQPIDSDEKKSASPSKEIEKVEVKDSSERRSPRISRRGVASIEDSTREEPKKEVAKKTVPKSEEDSEEKILIVASQLEIKTSKTEEAQIPADAIKNNKIDESGVEKVKESTERKSPRISRKGVSKVEELKSEEPPKKDASEKKSPVALLDDKNTEKAKISDDSNQNKDQSDVEKVKESTERKSPRGNRRGIIEGSTPEEPKNKVEKAVPKPEEPKKEVAKAAPKSEEPKKEVAKAAPKSEEPKKEVVKVVHKSEEPKKEVAKAVTKTEEPKKEVAKAVPKAEEPKKEVVAKRPVKNDSSSIVTEIAKIPEDSNKKDVPQGEKESTERKSPRIIDGSTSQESPKKVVAKAVPKTEEPKYVLGEKKENNEILKEMKSEDSKKINKMESVENVKNSIESKIPRINKEEIIKDSTREEPSKQETTEKSIPQPEKLQNDLGKKKSPLQIESSEIKNSEINKKSISISEEPPKKDLTKKAISVFEEPPKKLVEKSDLSKDKPTNGEQFKSTTGKTVLENSPKKYVIKEPVEVQRSEIQIPQVMKLEGKEVILKESPKEAVEVPKLTSEAKRIIPDLKPEVIKDNLEKKGDLKQSLQIAVEASDSKEISSTQKDKDEKNLIPELIEDKSEKKEKLVETPESQKSKPDTIKDTEEITSSSKLEITKDKPEKNGNVEFLKSQDAKIAYVKGVIETTVGKGPKTPEKNAIKDIQISDTEEITSTSKLEKSEELFQDSSEIDVIKEEMVSIATNQKLEVIPEESIISVEDFMVDSESEGSKSIHLDLSFSPMSPPAHEKVPHPPVVKKIEVIEIEDDPQEDEIKQEANGSLDKSKDKIPEVDNDGENSCDSGVEVTKPKSSVSSKTVDSVAENAEVEEKEGDDTLIMSSGDDSESSDEDDEDSDAESAKKLSETDDQPSSSLLDNSTPKTTLQRSTSDDQSLEDNSSSQKTDNVTSDSSSNDDDDRLKYRVSLCNLPKTATKENILAAFASAGVTDIVDIYTFLYSKRRLKANRAIISFSSEASKLKAIGSYGKISISGRPIYILLDNALPNFDSVDVQEVKKEETPKKKEARAKPKRYTAQISKVPILATANDILNCLAARGISSVTRITLHKPKKNCDVLKGYVKFSKLGSILKLMKRQHKFQVNGRLVKVIVYNEEVLKEFKVKYGKEYAPSYVDA